MVLFYQYHDFSFHKCVSTWKLFLLHQPYVGTIHRSPVDFPHNVLWCETLIFPFVSVWTNCWTNNPVTSVTVMLEVNHHGSFSKYGCRIASEGNSRVYGVLSPDPIPFTSKTAIWYYQNPKECVKTQYPTIPLPYLSTASSASLASA